MNEEFKKIKGIAIFFLKRLSILLLIVGIIVIVIAAIQYYILLDDGSYKEGDKSNTPYAVEEHTNSVTIDNDGKITTSLTAQELWEQMIENETRVDVYLDSPEELKKLINAQQVTDYLDTRENPNEPIDWKSINEDIDSKDVQGIIKLKREKSDGTVETLTYVDPETFQSYIDQYNQTGSDEFKEKALNHFTIEKGYQSSTGGNYEIGTDGKAEIIEKGDVIEIPQGQNYGTIYTFNSWQLIGLHEQLKLKEQAGMTFDNEGFGRINGRYTVATTDKFGKVGDYIDYYYIDKNGQEQIIPCIICDIKGEDAKNEWGHHSGTNILEFYVNEVTWCTPGWVSGLYPDYNDCGQASSMHDNPGTSSCHPEWQGSALKVINGGNYFDNPNFGSENITSNEDENTSSDTNSSIETSDEENAPLKWPTSPTAPITSPFGQREAPTAGASSNHQGIDIGVTTGTEVYATEAGTVVNSEYKDLNGNWIKIDHGNGFESLYLHNSQLLVSVGDVVSKGQVIALSGKSGIVSGPHLHFAIKLNGAYIDPLLYKYDNGQGNGTGGFGSAINVDSSSQWTTSGSAGYYAKVATWNETTEIVTSDDPEQEQKNVTQYSMITTKINYQQLTNEYKMPFDYLWALLVISQDKDFVLELADLVYNSEIEITIYDNLTENTTVMTDTYTKSTKVITDDIAVNVAYSGDNQIIYNKNEYGGPFTKELEQQYTTTTTIITKTNTINIILTKANVWIADYTQKAEKQVAEPTTTQSSNDFEDDEYPSEDSPDKEDAIDTAGLAEGFRQAKQREYLQTYTNVITRVTNLWSKYYYKTINRTVNNTSTTLTTKYISSPAETIEKTDKKSEEDNFVTLFIKYRTARSNIISGLQILVQILNNSEDTVEMIDLTKYLLYKATGEDYGVTEYNIQIINPNSMNKVIGNALENYIKLWENGALWAYETGRSTKFPSKYLTADEKNYIVYEDGSYGHNNIAYGIATFISSESNAKVVHPLFGNGYYNWQSNFSAYGIDVISLSEGSLVDKSTVLTVLNDIISGFQSSVKGKIADYLPEFNFSQAQMDALTAVCYQYGNINEFPDAYRNSLDENGKLDAEKLRRNYEPFNYSSTTYDRKYANWLLFTQEKYTNASGEEVISGG